MQAVFGFVSSPALQLLIITGLTEACIKALFWGRVLLSSTCVAAVRLVSLEHACTTSSQTLWSDHFCNIL